MKQYKGKPNFYDSGRGTQYISLSSKNHPAIIDFARDVQAAECVKTNMTIKLHLKNTYEVFLTHLAVFLLDRSPHVLKKTHSFTTF